MRTCMKLHCSEYWFGNFDMVDMGKGFTIPSQPVNPLVFSTLEVVDPEMYQELTSIADGGGWDV